MVAQKHIDNELSQRSCVALRNGAEAASPLVLYDRNDRAPHWKNNLMQSLHDQHDIENDLQRGAGKELDGKFRSAHSSSALVVNTFGPWRSRPASLSLLGFTGFHSLRFEAECPVWKERKFITHPHLDALLEGHSLISIESKCTEWMTRKTADFSDSYKALKPNDSDSPFRPWFDEMLELRAEPDRYRYIDAAQLIKHAFGLLRHFEKRDVVLVYLYWEP
jgi:hypothetical protein